MNPLSDAPFVGMAQGFAAAGTSEPAALQSALRPTYPRVVVHARELSGEAGVVLYVYRDGSWISDAGPE